MLQIGDSKYHYDENTYVFSGDERVSMEDIAQGDTLSVVGVDKQIVSVRITTAQGTLALKNTTLFEGSFLQQDIYRGDQGSVDAGSGRHV